MRKKLLTAVMALVLSIALTSCGDDDDDDCEGAGTTRITTVSLVDGSKSSGKSSGSHTGGSTGSEGKGSGKGKASSGGIKTDDDWFEECATDEEG